MAMRGFTAANTCPACSPLVWCDRHLVNHDSAPAAYLIRFVVKRVSRERTTEMPLARQPAQEDSDHRQHRSIVWTCHAEIHPQNRPARVLGKDRRQDSGAGIDRNASLTFRDDFYTVDLALNAPRLQRRVEII
jgi:hypothetical protein